MKKDRILDAVSIVLVGMILMSAMTIICGKNEAAADQAGIGKGPSTYREIVVSASTQTVTIANLDGNTAAGYNIEASITNSGGVASNYAIYINNDTTPGNYFSILYYGPTGSSYPLLAASAATNAVMIGMPASASLLLNGTISKSHTGNPVLTTESTRSDDFYFWGTVKNAATVTNITQLIIVSTAVNGIGAGSRVRIWRRR